MLFISLICQFLQTAESEKSAKAELANPVFNLFEQDILQISEEIKRSEIRQKENQERKTLLEDFLSQKNEKEAAAIRRQLSDTIIFENSKGERTFASWKLSFEENQQEIPIRNFYLTVFEQAFGGCHCRKDGSILLSPDGPLAKEEVYKGSLLSSELEEETGKYRLVLRKIRSHCVAFSGDSYIRLTFEMPEAHPWEGYPGDPDGGRSKALLT